MKALKISLSAILAALILLLLINSFTPQILLSTDAYFGFYEEPILSTGYDFLVDRVSTILANQFYGTFFEVWILRPTYYILTNNIIPSYFACALLATLLSVLFSKKTKRNKAGFKALNIIASIFIAIEAFVCIIATLYSLLRMHKPFQMLFHSVFNIQFNKLWFEGFFFDIVLIARLVINVLFFIGMAAASVLLIIYINKQAKGAIRKSKLSILSPIFSLIGVVSCSVSAIHAFVNGLSYNYFRISRIIIFSICLVLIVSAIAFLLVAIKGFLNCKKPKDIFIEDLIEPYS